MLPVSGLGNAARQTRKLLYTTSINGSKAERVRPLGVRLR
jgi:hypothetical protein